MKMSGPMQGQPLLTVEQFELIRRLRNSGITKEQVHQAFDMLARMDQELGPLFTVPMSLAAGFPGMPQLRQVVPNSVAANTVNAAMMALGAQAQALQAQAQMRAQVPQQPNFSTPVKQESNNVQSRKRPAEQSVNGDNGISESTQGALNNTTPNGGYIDDDIENTEEYKEMNSRGDLYCCDEIRNFVIQHNIKQQQVAVLAGISQSYVSRYLKGDLMDMSEKSRKTMLKWYLTFRKNPPAIAPTANSIIMNQSPIPIKKFLSMDAVNSPEYANYPKRERFVFRPSHLEVLERYFQEDSYPSQEKRDEIARFCNAAVEVPGRHLGEKERVTPQIVANWFANRRKEIKKMAREEGIDISQVPLRGRGRPARFISEMSPNDMKGMASNGSNFPHSNGHMMSSAGSHGNVSSAAAPLNMTLPHSDSVDLTMASQASIMPHSAHHTSLTSNSSSSPSGSPPHRGSNSTGMASMVDSPSSDEQPPTSSRKSIEHDEHRSQTPQTPSTPRTPEMEPSGGIDNESSNDNNTLSLAVEMAAVNQAIMALSGQTPIGVKKEMMDAPAPAPVTS